MELKVKRLTDTAKLPTRNKHGDMGYDIYADEDIVRSSHKLESIKTGIAIELPKGYGAFLVGRSGRTSSSLFRVNLGVIDNGYRGEILVMNDILDNGEQQIERFEKGDKIAQLIILPIYDIEVIEVESLSSSDRGDNGFGSSGSK